MSHNPTVGSENKSFDCQMCGRLIEGTGFVYHPYWYCVLQKAGQLDTALADIESHYSQKLHEAKVQARIDELSAVVSALVGVSPTQAIVNVHQIKDRLEKLKQEGIK